MTSAERKQLRMAMSRANERAQIREAIAAGAVAGSIDRLLGDELIAASREVVQAWHQRANSEDRMTKAIAHLEELVGHDLPRLPELAS